MRTELERFRALRDDILLEHIPFKETSVIFMHDTAENQSNKFRVLAVGPDATELKVGDVVIASWQRITEPFMLDDGDNGKRRVAITSEKEIHAVYV